MAMLHKPPSSKLSASKSSKVSDDRQKFWRELIAQHASSRLSVERFCQQAGVSTASFYVWRKRLKRSEGRASAPLLPRPTPSLVPLRIAAEQHVGEQITVEIAADSSLPVAIRIFIPPRSGEASVRQVLGAVLAVRAGAE